MTKFEVLKGTQDSVPSKQIELNRVLDIIRVNFEKYGFRPFDTPIIEYLETLTNKYDEDAEIVGEIFKVTDRGERKLGLRYDLTIPLCRFIASQKQLKLPFRRYAIGKVFRDGPIKPGRLREFIQCDADVVGITGQASEAEVLKMFFDTYGEIGIKAVLEINNNKILRGAFIQFGFRDKDIDSLVLSVDKLKKIGVEGVLEEIKSKGMDTKKASEAIKILESKNFKDIRKLAKDKLLNVGIDELEELVNYLDKLKVNYRINFSMSRGLNYYTGNIWEMYDKEENIKSSIGSGGRYNKGIGNYIDDGNEYPAFGVSFGVSAMLSIIEKKGSSKESNVDTLVVPLDENLIETALKIANKRREFENVEVCYDFKLKKGFSYSEYLGCKNIVILGEKDAKEGVYTIRNLETKKEEKIKI